MATNLLFLTPDIPYAATNYQTYTTSTAVQPNEADFYPFRNSLRGEKWQLYNSGSDAVEHNQVCDCGIASGVAITKSANFLVLSRLDIMQTYKASIYAANIDFALQSSSDDSSYTDRATITDITTVSLIGPWANDYVTTFTATSAFRYWRCHWTKSAGAAYPLKIGKMYFGSSFDIGRDVDSFSVQRLTPGDTAFITNGGVEYPVRIKHPTYEITLRYVGITDANLALFKAAVSDRAATTPVFLYEQGLNGFTEVTDGKRLIFMKLTNFDTSSRKYNWNEIELKFLESVG